MNLSNILTYFTTSWGYVTVQGDSLITPVGCNRGIRRNCRRPFGLLTDSLSCAKKKKKTKTHTTIFLTSCVNVHKTFKNYKLSFTCFSKALLQRAENYLSAKINQHDYLWLQEKFSPCRCWNSRREPHICADPATGLHITPMNCTAEPTWKSWWQHRKIPLRDLQFSTKLN